MTAARLPPLWVADQVRNDGVWDAGMMVNGAEE